MTKHPIFLGYGLLLLTAVNGFQWYGMSLQPINERKNVPKSIRDNPGAWRSHYGTYPRYMGGK
ncbi:MAG: hypothetical protein FJW31_00765 [Acidobacteria bacterium]|nr:hypothetical protein [Acidobacteriota bacterium]